MNKITPTAWLEPGGKPPLVNWAWLEVNRCCLVVVCKRGVMDTVVLFQLVSKDQFGGCQILPYTMALATQRTFNQLCHRGWLNNIKNLNQLIFFNRCCQDWTCQLVDGMLNIRTDLIANKKTWIFIFVTHIHNQNVTQNVWGLYGCST